MVQIGTTVTNLTQIATRNHVDLQNVTADQHHAQSHSHASHTGIGANDHHAQSHAHASHTGIGANDHHAQNHTTANHTVHEHSLFIPAAGMTHTGALIVHDNRSVVELVDGQSKSLYFTLLVPREFSALYGIELVWLASVAAGNLYLSGSAAWGTVGEDDALTVDPIPVSAIATAGNTIINESALVATAGFAGLAAYDHLGVMVTRQANDPLDTLGVSIYVLGLILHIDLLT